MVFSPLYLSVGVGVSDLRTDTFDSLSISARIGALAPGPLPADISVRPSPSDRADLSLMAPSFEEEPRPDSASNTLRVYVWKVKKEIGTISHKVKKLNCKEIIFKN